MEIFMADWNGRLASPGYDLITPSKITKVTPGPDGTYNVTFGEGESAETAKISFGYQPVDHSFAGELNSIHIEYGNGAKVDVRDETFFKGAYDIQAKGNFPSAEKIRADAIAILNDARIQHDPAQNVGHSRGDFSSRLDVFKPGEKSLRTPSDPPSPDSVHSRSRTPDIYPPAWPG
jgi:hypothetical protein